MQIEVTAERIRGIGSQVMREQMTTTCANAFMALYEEDLERHLLEALSDYVRTKLGK